MMPNTRLLVPLLAMVTAVASSGATTSVTTFDLPDRVDATPSIAARGDDVAVTWGASAEGKADVYVAMSVDGGATFAAPVRVNTVPGEARLGGELPPRVALTGAGRQRRPDVVVLWTARGASTEIKLARSRDGGRTFEAPTALQTTGASGDRGWPALTVDSRGQAHAVWLDHRGQAPRAPASGGKPHVHGAAAPRPAGAGVDFSKGSALRHATSGPAAVPDQAIASGVCYCCKTALAAGPDDAIYAAWRHVYPGELRDVAMAVSRDGGRRFSTPARVSEDGWAIQGCPDDGPAVAVDQRGTVHVVWPTVVGGDTPEGALFYATSTDGLRFTPRLRVPTLGSPKPTHPQIVLHGERVFVAWDELVAGRRVAALREATRTSGGTLRTGEVVTVAPAAAASHPVVAATRDGLVAVWTTGGENARVEARRIAVPTSR
jgi:hypothetical protein